MAWRFFSPLLFFYFLRLLPSFIAREILRIGGVKKGGKLILLAPTFAYLAF